MEYYIPKMLPEYVEVEPDVFQPYSDATVAGWRNEHPDCRERAPVQSRPAVSFFGVADQ